MCMNDSMYESNAPVSKPFITCEDHGWCNVTIGDFSSRASYITDVPLDCLDAAIRYLKHRNTFAVSFDAEGWNFIVVSDCIRSYVIVDKNSTIFYANDEVYGAGDLALQIYEDVAGHIDEWSLFLSSEDVDTNKEMIREALAELRGLLIEEGLFDDGR